MSNWDCRAKYFNQGTEGQREIDILRFAHCLVNRGTRQSGNEIAHFVDCISKGTQCISPAEDGVEIMKILDAVYESARTGKEVVL